MNIGQMYSSCGVLLRLSVYEKGAAKHYMQCALGRQFFSGTGGEGCIILCGLKVGVTSQLTDNHP